MEQYYWNCKKCDADNAVCSCDHPVRMLIKAESELTKLRGLVGKCREWIEYLNHDNICGNHTKRNCYCGMNDLLSDLKAVGE